MADSPLRLIIMARDQSDRVQDAWRELDAFLKQQSGVEVVAAAVTEDLELDDLEADLVITLGGDGAILRACRQLGARQLPLIGINLGRLGFLTDLSPEQFRDVFPQIVARDYRVIEHLMFECTFRSSDGTSESFLGLNEVAVSSAGSLKMLDVELAIDGKSVTTYSCDGLIVSTPVGSTAHSLSAGGPILRQDLHAFVITPICPHTLSNRPLVDSADCMLTLSLPAPPDGTKLVIDGQMSRSITAGDVIEVRRAPVTFKLARVAGYSFYANLHRKLGWVGQPQYRKR